MRFVLGLGCLALLASGCSSSSNPSSPSSGSLVTVQINNSIYSPNPMTMKVGQQVNWKNNDAITHTAEHRPDVVLMDLSLPVLDGWEATRRLKTDHRTAHIPVVALTAHDGSGELQRATRAGCDWFVPKPCPPDALVVEIRRVLEQN